MSMQSVSLIDQYGSNVRVLDEAELEGVEGGCPIIPIVIGAVLLASAISNAVKKK